MFVNNICFTLDVRFVECNNNSGNSVKSFFNFFDSKILILVVENS